MVHPVDQILKNYYDILGIPQNANKEEIKSAYRKLSLKFHPDKNNGEEFFEAMFKNINEANEILTNDTKRFTYDAQLRKYNDAKDAFSRQDEVRRKEDELRRRQEELLRREQELKEQQFSNKGSTISNNSEIDWSRTVNIFMGINAFLLIVIFLTPNKNEKLLKHSSLPLLPTNAPSAKYKSKIIRPVTIIKEPTDSTENSSETILDSSAEIKFTPTELPETKQEEKNINTKESEVNVDSVAEKPKWYQFKKRREWNKKKNSKTE